MAITDYLDNQPKTPLILVFSLIWLSMLAAFILNVQPVFLGALAETFNLNGQQLGLLSGAELGGSFLASLSAAYWFPRALLRIVALCAILAGIFGNLLTSFAADYGQLVAIRFFTGLFGSGMLYAVALGLMGQLHQPDRVIGVAIFVQVLSLAIGLTLIPVLMTQWQLPGVTVSLALLFSTGLLLFKFLPLKGRVFATSSLAQTQMAKRSWVLSVTLILSLIIFSLGLGSLWAFLDRFGDQAGFDTIEIGSALAVAAIIGGFGALAAAFLGTRFGRTIPIAIGVSLEVVACLILSTGADWHSYLLAIGIFNFCWNFTLPYLIGAIAASDLSGRFTVLIPAAQTGGYALGPTIVGIMMVGNDYATAAWISAGAFSICLAMVVTTLRRSPKIAN